MQKADYAARIKMPIGLLSIKALIRGEANCPKILTFDHLRLALLLMRANSVAYNGAATEYTRIAQACLDEYDRARPLEEQRLTLAQQKQERADHAVAAGAEERRRPRADHADYVVSDVPERRCAAWSVFAG